MGEGWSATVSCSRGTTTIMAGLRWTDPLSGSEWEVVEPAGERMYSPSGLGGTPTFWCRHVGGAMATAWTAGARADGCINFCGDSIAASHLARVALAQSTPAEAKGE